MKQYVIDGFTLKDYSALKQYFDTNLEPATVGGIYWLELDPGILTPIQAAHNSCGPHVFALMLEETALSCELLVRIKTNIRCDCMGYATVEQRNWLADWADAVLEKLSICI
ncbi:hypothetical protein [Desulfobacter vibrioformis]|uniref:hypothetical protein n=1 Tax=Desulfobacter vibrioformis TaxID=34031 RepID=UPI00055430CD|nr:hypothetical protein [Desulfobacter vibrioformis]